MTIDELLAEFPPWAREQLRDFWESLSEERREQFEETLEAVPPGAWQTVFKFVVETWAGALGTKKNIAILGPANVGKSTLYNQLILRDEDLAETGPRPGTTRENQTADLGLINVTDTPGADAVGEIGEEERRRALDAAEAADFLVMMFEATRGIKRSERALFDELKDSKKPSIVVMNKIDLVRKKDRGAVLDAAAENLDLNRKQLIDTVATKGTNVDRVVMAIVKTEPALLGAIADALPSYRRQLAWRETRRASAAAAIVGGIPVPLMDIVPLLAIQSGLVLAIARIYGFKLSGGRAKELVPTFIAGVAARTLFQQLAKLGGPPGWVLSASIAASTTAIIGWASILWFEKGEKPSSEAMREKTRELAVVLKDALASLGDERPEDQTIMDTIRATLDTVKERLFPEEGESETTDEPNDPADNAPATP